MNVSGETDLQKPTVDRINFTNIPGGVITRTADLPAMIDTLPVGVTISGEGNVNGILIGNGFRNALTTMASAGGGIKAYGVCCMRSLDIANITESGSIIAITGQDADPDPNGGDKGYAILARRFIQDFPMNNNWLNRSGDQQTIMLAATPVMLTSRTDAGNDANNTLLAAASSRTASSPESPSWGLWMQGYGLLTRYNPTCGNAGVRYRW